MIKLLCLYLARGYRAVHDGYTGTTSPVGRLGTRPLAVARTPML